MTSTWIRRFADRCRGARSRNVALTGIALCAVAVVFAACGGGGSPSGVASVGSSTSSTSPSSAPAGNSGPPPSPALQKAQLAYSVCMRKNGVSAFPDPVSDGGYAGTSLRNIDQNSHAFVTATKDCSYLAKAAGMAPWTQAQWTAYDAMLLKITDCMRAHGVTNFPDPKGGEKGGWLNPTGPLDVTSSLYAKAAKACNGPPGQAKSVSQNG
jgi:hypothetical protein